MFHHDRKFLANQKNHRKIDPVDLFKGDAESVVTGELLRAGTDTTRTSGGGDGSVINHYKQNLEFCCFRSFKTVMMQNICKRVVGWNTSL